MTGFGAATGQRKGVSVRVEVRSVNHRHLQAKVRLPLEFQYLESDVEGAARKKLHRGSVAINVHLVRGTRESDVNVDFDVARAYARQLDKLTTTLSLAGELRAADLIQLPGVIAVSDVTEPDAGEAKLILRTIDKALAGLIEMRTREGTALSDDLLKNSGVIKRVHGQITRRMPKVVKAHHANLTRRVEELVGGGNVTEADLAREVALIADRLDVSEELSRLDAHLEQLAELLAKGGAIGRKLDFLSQEFFREANTIGSKCNDATVSHHVVDLKTHIERMREQVQNVE